MAININTVYQKVLALANKEQRGYITPQEFNLLADKAQNEIYENSWKSVKSMQVYGICSFRQKKKKFYSIF